MEKDPNLDLSDAEEKRKIQQEKLEFLRNNISPQNHDFIRKELLISGDFDIDNLLYESRFDQFYELKDQGKEESLLKIKREGGIIQGVGIIAAIPFLFMRIKTKESLWLLPGITSIAGTKWYSTKMHYQRLNEYGVDQYWRKSKKLDGDLRRVDNYISQRKLFQKANNNSS